MDRRAVARALSSAVALPLALHEEAEAELASAREEVAQLRAALGQEKDAHEQSKRIWHKEANGLADKVQAERHLRESDASDYERTVAGLHERLREEEARRASYQAVDAIARRFVERFRQENPRQGWQAGWRCPIPEMRALLEAVDPVEAGRDPDPFRGA